MNILIYNWRDIKNPSAGGAEIFTHEIGKRLISRGFDVSLFTSEFKGCKKYEVIDGIKINRQGNKYTVYFKAKNYYENHMYDYDVVIDEINTRPFMTPKFLKNNTKLIALIHQLAREFWYYETHFPISWLGYHLLEDYWLKNYLDVPTITISQSTKTDLDNLGFKNVSIIPCGINVKPLDENPKKEVDPTFIFVGRMKYCKQPSHAIEAFGHIKRKLPNAKLWMIGDGPLRKQLKKKAFEGITFFGYVDSDTKYSLMSKAHAILVPGIREGWGLIVTEANAMGTPAIGYDVPGLKDSIKDGVTGILCDANPKAMSEGAVHLLGNYELLNEYNKNALNWAKEFDWDRTTEKLAKIIEMSI